MLLTVAAPVKPVFGKIEAGGSTTVEFIFKADCIPMIFEDNIKVMVREVINTTKRRQRKNVKVSLNREAQVYIGNSPLSLSLRFLCNSFVNFMYLCVVRYFSLWLLRI